jgi:hypothetical protein
VVAPAPRRHLSNEQNNHYQTHYAVGADMRDAFFDELIAAARAAGYYTHATSHSPRPVMTSPLRSIRCFTCRSARVSTCAPTFDPHPPQLHTH